MFSKQILHNMPFCTKFDRINVPVLNELPLFLQIHRPFLPWKCSWPRADEQLLHRPRHSHQLQHLLLRLLRLRRQYWQAHGEEPVCRHWRGLACFAHTVTCMTFVESVCESFNKEAPCFRETGARFGWFAVVTLQGLKFSDGRRGE